MRIVAFVVLVCMSLQEARSQALKLTDLNVSVILPTSSAGDGRTREAIERDIATLVDFDLANYDAEMGLRIEDGFAPLGAMGLRIPRLKSHLGFRRLVSDGDTSIPFLLQHLADTRPTMLRFGDVMGQASVSECNVLVGNPCNTHESGLTVYWGQRITDIPLEESRLTRSDVVSVGDICAMALGQIVGRNYAPVRPLGHFKSTPVYFPFSRSAKLADQLKKQWANCEKPGVLCESLIIDFRSRDTEVHYDAELDYYDSYSSDIVCRSALRLLFWFPDVGLDLVCAELERKSGKNCFEHGVNCIDLIDVVSWHASPRLTESFEKLLQRGTDAALIASLEKSLANRRGRKTEGEAMKK